MQISFKSIFILVAIHFIMPVASIASASANLCSRILIDDVPPQKKISVARLLRPLKIETNDFRQLEKQGPVYVFEKKTGWKNPYTQEQTEALRLELADIEVRSSFDKPYSEKPTVFSSPILREDQKINFPYRVMSAYLESQGIQHKLVIDLELMSLQIVITPDSSTELGRLALKNFEDADRETILSLPLHLYRGFEKPRNPFVRGKLGYYDGDFFYNTGVSNTYPFALPRPIEYVDRVYIPISQVLGKKNKSVGRSSVFRNLTAMFKTYDQLPPTIGIEIEGRSVDREKFGKFFVSMVDKLTGRRASTIHADSVVSLENQSSVHDSSEWSTRPWSWSPEKLIEKSRTEYRLFQDGKPLVGVEIRSPVLRSVKDKKASDEAEFFAVLEEVRKREDLFSVDEFSAGLHIHLGLGKVTSAEVGLIYYAFNIIDAPLRDYYNVSPTRRHYTYPVFPEVLHLIEQSAIKGDPTLSGAIYVMNAGNFEYGKQFVRYNEKYKTLEFGLPNSTTSEHQIKGTIDFLSSFVVALRSKNPAVLKFLEEVDSTDGRDVVKDLMKLLEHQKTL